MMTTRLARAVMAALVIAALPAIPAVALGPAVDQTCVLALTKFDPATVNIAYPDDSAQYYTGFYQLVPGTRIRITGQFPHARYMSFNVYDPAQRPIDGLSDIGIEPDPGSTNPFLDGADRTSENGRAYTVFIDSGPPPADRGPNTLYTGAGQNAAPNINGSFIYRIYVPDNGRDDTGGVGLPTVSIESTTSTGTPPASACSGVEKPSVGGINEALAAQATPVDAPTTSGANPPRWRKFVNLLSSVAVNVTGSPRPAGVDFDALGGSGGFLSNRDNAYVSAPINRSYGRVLVVRFRAPTFADTRGPAAVMAGGQLRYWSLCENDPPTQRMVACLNDDRVVVGADGFATFVVSPPDQRPACAANWLPWGPNQRGVLIYRHMLPDPAFAQAVQRAEPDHEVDTMGDYLPVSQYFADAAAYERSGGCAGA